MFNVQYSTFNVQCSMFNVQRSTFNVHPLFSRMTVMGWFSQPVIVSPT